MEVERNLFVRPPINVTLVCSVTASPKITNGFWKLPNGTTIDFGFISDKYIAGVSPTPSLTIRRNTDSDDLGFYSCVAQNGALEEEALVFLTNKIGITFLKDLFIYHSSNIAILSVCINL